MHVFTVYDLLAHNLPQRRDATAIITAKETVTYGALATQVETLASWLAAQGVQRGDRVGIHLPKSVDEVVATFAIARLGAVFVNINVQWTAAQVRFVISDCDIRLMVTDFARARKLVQAEVTDQLDRLCVAGKALEHPKAEAWPEQPLSGVLPPPPALDVDLAALIYTSGSTGQPKGVMLTHLNIVQGARSVASYLVNSPADRVMGLVPMSFDYGLSQVTTQFLSGGTIVLQPVVMPAEVVKSINTHKVTGLAAVPPTWIQLIHWLKENPVPLPSLRYVTNTGGKIPMPTLEQMPALLAPAQIFLMYGLTEAFRSTYLPPHQFADKMGAIGQAIPNNEIFVVDPEKGICGPGEQGELVHRGNLISQGYWRNPEATEARIGVCEHLRPLIGDEKVVFSGDLVRRDEDGILWFVSRADAMIKCSGFRISPTEVEDLVHQSGSTQDVVAFGVEDDQLGEVVHVAVSFANGSGDEAELRKHCQKTMPHYMVPHTIHTWPTDMPRTSTGKLDRNAVIATCHERLTIDDGAAEGGRMRASV